jgi:hypothetical protein
VMEKYFEMNPIQGAPPIAAPDLTATAAQPGASDTASAPAPVPVDPSD